MTLLPAWAVDGARVPAAMARRALWTATSGAGGIVQPADLRVIPRGPTGPGVQVLPGGALLPSLFPGGSGESYQIYNDAAVDVPVAAAGSGGRTDILGIRIDDPQFAGQAPADPLTAKYCSFVLVSAIPTTYPFIPLARIVQPANNGAVQANMITDLRTVALPRRTRDLYNTQPSATSAINSPTYTDWTPSANRDILIPAWASQVKIIGHVAGAAPAGAATTGQVRCILGPLVGQGAVFDMDASTRQTLLASDTFAVPANLRGVTQTLKLQAARQAGTGSIKTDMYSTIVWDVEFLQVASAD